MESLTEEFKLVTLENYEFETRRKNNINWTFLHFWPIKNPI